MNLVTRSRRETHFLVVERVGAECASPPRREMVRVVGLEPTASAFRGRHSPMLSYTLMRVCERWKLRSWVSRKAHEAESRGVRQLQSTEVMRARVHVPRLP